MKKCKIIIALMLLVFVMISAVACTLVCKHIDENLDHKCDVCSEAMGECADANKDHKCDVCSEAMGECADANKDHKCDYGCGKVIGNHIQAAYSHSCAYCGEKFSECTPNADDGDCTTAIFCSVCREEMTAARDHVAVEDDNDCSTPVKCVNCDKNAIEAKPHVAGEDDGDCETPVKCVNCDQIAIEGGDHTPVEEGKCLCGYTCEATCNVCGRCQDTDCVLCANKCYFSGDDYLVSPFVPGNTMENKDTGAKQTMSQTQINGLTGVRFVSNTKMNFRILNRDNYSPLLKNDMVYYRLVVKNNGSTAVEFKYQVEYFGVRGEAIVKVAPGETVEVLLVQKALGDRDNASGPIHDVIFTSGNNNGYDITIAGQVAVPNKEIKVVGATINGATVVRGSGYGFSVKLDPNADVAYEKDGCLGWLYNGVLYNTYAELAAVELNYYTWDTIRVLYPDYITLKGEGTESSPWLISSAEDLVTIARIINDDIAFADDYYRLTCDIDFNGLDVDFDGISTIRAFGGTFDGNGYVIKNLYIDTEGKNNTGLFGIVTGGTIKNLGIESGMIEGGNYVGSLIGSATNATIINCFNEATVRGNNNIGGLVGSLTNSSMHNSFNRGLVRLSGRQMIGGLIGYAKSSTVSNCYNMGRVGVGTLSGQIVGKAENDMIFANVWYNKEAAVKEQPIGSYNVFDGIIGVTGAELIAESFVTKLNANIEDGYMAWSYGNDKIARLATFKDCTTLSAFIASIDGVSINNGKVESIVSEDGKYKTVVYGSDNKNVISLDGIVYQPLTTQKVLLILDVVDVATSEVVARVDRNIEVTVEGKYNDSGVNEMPEVLPSLREWHGLEGNFKVTDNSRIVVTDRAMNEMSERIQAYFKDMFGLELNIVDDTNIKAGDIVLKYNPDRADLGDEGNAIEIDDKIIIESSTETGMLYGAISIMQIMKQSENGNTVPKGYVRDYPAYELRGGMIEVCRKIFSLDYVEEIGKYMSWFKLNTLHLHINEANGELGATFVVESKKYPQLNNSVGSLVWSQDDYRQMQKDLKKFGVNVITEIDTPGHANVFDAIDTNNAVNGFNFDLGGHYDEALELIKGVFDEFLDGEDPVFQNSIVHMGTDESGNSSENMRRYISDLSQYLLAKDNVDKVVFWGNLTLYYGETEIDPENVITQIWDGVDYRVDEALDQGFEIINSTSNMLYCVPDNDKDFSYGNYFSGYADIAAMYDTWKGGGDFDTHDLANPSNFSKGNMYNSFDILYGNPKVLGAMFALWNSNSVGRDYDILHLIIPWIVNVSERCWYGDSDSHASGEEFEELFNKVGNYAPYANPRNYVESDSNIVASYDFESMTNGVVIDSSNGYNATVVNGSIVNNNGSNVLALNGNTSLHLPFDGVGYPYAVDFDIYLTGTQSSNAILFECDECTFYLNYNDKGIAYQAGRWIFLFNVKIPTDKWTNVKITSQFTNWLFASENTTIVTVNGQVYMPTCVWSSATTPKSSVLGTENVFVGINGYVDNLCIKNEYEPPFAGFSFEGKGTAESPYLIQNATDLQMFAKFSNAGLNLSSYYKLTADIDMTGVEYTPVGQFKGTLDGSGHVISNLTITSASERIGLISFLDGGTIKNLGIVDSTISGSKYVGAFAGRTMNAVIMNCFTNATVIGSGNDIGGFVGMFNSSKMYNCYSLATVSGNGSVGGFVGSANTSLNKNNIAEFDNVYSFAKVSGNNSNVGMIAGYDEGSSANTPVQMTSVYYCGDKNASGNYAGRVATKLSEAQLTDGTLLNYLNSGVKTGYTSWEVDENGYPGFYSNSKPRVLTIEGATINGESSMSLNVGAGLDASANIVFSGENNLGWIYNGKWYATYEELAAAFVMPAKNCTIKAVYFDDDSRLVADVVRNGIMENKVSGKKTNMNPDTVNGLSGYRYIYSGEDAFRIHSTYAPILSDDIVFYYLVFKNNDTTAAVEFTYQVEYFGVRGEVKVSIPAGETVEVFLVQSAATGKNNSTSPMNDVIVTSCGEGGFDITIAGKVSLPKKEIKIEGATIDGKNVIEIAYGLTASLDANAEVVYDSAKGTNYGWIYNGLYYETYADVSKVALDPNACDTIKAVYAEDFTEKFVPSCRVEARNDGTGDVLPTVSHVTDENGALIATRYTAAANENNEQNVQITNGASESHRDGNGTNLSLAQFFKSNKNCFLLTFTNNSDEAISFTYWIDGWGKRGEVTVELAAGETKTVQLVQGYHGTNTSASLLHGFKNTDAAEGYDITIGGYVIIR